MKTPKLIFYLALLICTYGCNNNQSSPVQINKSNESDNPSSSAIAGENGTDNTLHVDSNYKYEYRTGTSGAYEYNYDVEGSDDNGKSVTGNISVSGKYGTGTITDEDGDEQDIDVEWVDYGKLEGTDENNNTYELEVQ
ncbi:hypothetical protein ABIB62_003785 [Mucilaginibacter sp. UYP25]|uniref:hypothetical protein n=1 Tax=unclassified Mucilaginibacter TaxID=2617802 RepID=UPI00339991F7